MPYDFTDYKDEIDIQNIMNRFLENEKFGPIINEYITPVLRSEKHQYILLDELLKYIEILNSNIWNSNLYKESKLEIINLIKKDFLNHFDEITTSNSKAPANNKDIHNLIFGRDSKMITLTNKDGSKNNCVNYRVVDTDYQTDCRNNEIKIIREKIIKISPRFPETQRPDFAVYLNGLPFIIIEVKSPTSSRGIYDALIDYKTKVTYQRFLSCLCTDGKNAAFTFDPTSISLDHWKAYGNHKSLRYSEDNSGFIDFCEEILFNTKNFVFYFQYGTFPMGKHLGNLRVQQYYVMKAAFNLLSEKKNGFREVVKQPPRSGKTIAIRSMINMITMNFHDVFEKIFIQVPDLTIADQFKKDFTDFKFNHGYTVKNIDRRNKSDKQEDSNNYSYEEAIQDKNKCIYIMNMQKITDELSDFENDSHKILVFIDEVHTHQLGENSKIRNLNFPNASYITFTATTRKKIIDKVVTDLTLTEYSTSNKFLDELYNEDAKDLNMVIPMSYEKIKYDPTLNIKRAKEFSTSLEEEIKKEFYNNPKYSKVKEQVDLEVVQYAESLKNDPRFQKNESEPNITELFETIAIFEEKVINKKTNGLINKIKSELLRKIKVNLIPESLQCVISNFKTKITDNYSYKDEQSKVLTPYFKAKAFWVTDDQRMANEIAKYIQTISNDTNIIEGVKFGMDYSAANSYDEEDFIHKFNKIKYGNTIKNDFDSAENDSTDILIIVGKYLMGYDNKRLIAVFCDTNISEPSRIFQLYTRPATKFYNKNIGFFVDMSFDNGNHDAFKTALSWYESEKNNSTIFLDEDRIDIQRNNLRDQIQKIEDIVKLDANNFVKTQQERNLFIKDVNEEDQQAILNLCKQISVTTKYLVSPAYYKDFLPQILVINKALYGLRSYLQANKKDLLFTRKDIEVLFFDFMKILNITNVDEIMRIQIEDGSFIIKDDFLPSRESLISNNLYHVNKLLRSSEDYIHINIFERLKMLTERIEGDNQWNDNTYRESQRIEEESKKAKLEIKKLITEEFEDKTDFFIVYNVIKKYLEKKEISNTNEKVFKDFSRSISNDIKSYINNNFPNKQIEINEDFSEKIRSCFKDRSIKLCKEDKDLMSKIFQTLGSDQNKIESREFSARLIEKTIKDQYEFL